VALGTLAAVPITGTPAQAQAAGACSVAFSASQWNDGNGGFTAMVTITNLGDPVSGWTLSFDLPGSAQLTQGWSAVWNQQGQTVTAQSLDWNANLGTDGQAVIGFNGSGYAGDPTAFTLDGTTCDGGQPGEPAIVWSPGQLDVPEGGSSAVNVQLSEQPAGTVIVDLAASGDPDISVSPTSLTLDASNWNTGQTATVSAAEDDDTTNGTATVTASAAGHTSDSVSASEVDNDQPPVGDQPLRDLADGRDFLIGMAVQPAFVANEPPYAETLAREFNAVTAENAMKWDATEPSPGQFTFGDADAVVATAQANNQTIHGHTLVWHNQTPGWVQGLPENEMRAAMQNHISTVVNRYEDQVDAWDVVNEAFNEDGSLRDSFWRQTLGNGYIAEAFQAARAADPDAKLYINDFNVEGINAKSNGLFNLVQDLRAQGVPIDGVGLQGHLILGQVPSSIQANIQRFADLGVEVKITELDIRIPLPADDNELAQQALDYRAVADACLAVAGCEGITTWGFTDLHSWVPGFFDGQGAALPFDENYQPKPAYDALNAALAG
jgi:endo-1,4-beta-xylanase